MQSEPEVSSVSAQIKLRVAQLFSLLSAAVVISAMCSPTCDAQYFPVPKDFQTYYLAFLNTPASEGTQGGGRAELAALPNAEGIKLLGMFDSDGVHRSFAIFSAASPEAARAVIDAEPSVQERKLSYELRSVPIPRNWFDFQPAASSAPVVGFTLVVLSDAPDRPQVSANGAQELQNAHLAHLHGLAREGKLYLSALLLEKGRDRGVALMRTGAPDQARQWLSEDPAVRGGYLVLNAWPVHILRGNVINTSRRIVCARVQRRAYPV